MEEKTITIRCYNVATNEYYDKEVPYEYDLVQGKQNKLNELENYIAELKEQGVEFNKRMFKCDDEAQNNLMQTAMFVDALLPITWFSRNGESGYIVIETKEEFNQFVGVLAGKMAEIKNKYYQYKYAIEQAQTEEDLEKIVFIDSEE